MTETRPDRAADDGHPKRFRRAHGRLREQAMLMSDRVLGADG